MKQGIEGKREKMKVEEGEEEGRDDRKWREREKKSRSRSKGSQSGGVANGDYG